MRQRRQAQVVPMVEWQIRLFGAPKLVQSDRTIPIPRRKQWALLSYLLLTGHPVRRETLAALLWPGYSQARAHANLRRELSRLRGLAGGLLHYDGDAVSIVTGGTLLSDPGAITHHGAG